MKHVNHQRASWIRAIAGYGLAIAAILFTANSLKIGWHNLELSGKSNLPWRPLAGSIVLLLIHTLLNRKAFLSLCKATAIDLPENTLRRIWGRSLLTKYVPGGIWQIASRAVLMKSQGVLSSRALATGVAEQLISITVCAVLALSATSALYWTNWHGFFVLMAGLTSVLATSHLRWFTNQKIARRAMLLYISAMPCYLFAYSILASDVPLIQLCAQLFTGTLAGMLVFFVPGGLGIRESVATLLNNDTTSNIMGAMIAARLVTIAIECTLTLMTWFGSKPDQ